MGSVLGHKIAIQFFCVINRLCTLLRNPNLKCNFQNLKIAFEIGNVFKWAYLDIVLKRSAFQTKLNLEHLNAPFKNVNLYTVLKRI